jgi:outer membrane autotransporter protein
VELAGGMSARITEDFSAYARLSYTFNISGNYERATQGNIGVRWTL